MLNLLSPKYERQIQFSSCENSKWHVHKSNGKVIFGLILHKHWSVLFLSRLLCSNHNLEPANMTLSRFSLFCSETSAQTASQEDNLLVQNALFYCMESFCHCKYLTL